MISEEFEDRCTSATGKFFRSRKTDITSLIKSSKFEPEQAVLTTKTLAAQGLMVGAGFVFELTLGFLWPSMVRCIMYTPNAVIPTAPIISTTNANLQKRIAITQDCPEAKLRLGVAFLDPVHAGSSSP